MLDQGVEVVILGNVKEACFRTMNRYATLEEIGVSYSSVNCGTENLTLKIVNCCLSQQKTKKAL